MDTHDAGLVVPHGTAPARREIPEATIARLPVYLRTLEALADDGTPVASSQQLAESCGVNPAQVRKDLSYLGSHGVRGVGYDVRKLIGTIAGALGHWQQWRVAIVGVGNLGRALAQYRGFLRRGFEVVAVFDADPYLTGQPIGELTIEPMDRLEEVLGATRATIGVIATPASSAQQVADLLVGAGIRAVLNFAPAIIQVPDGVMVRAVDVSVELQVLAYYLQGQHTA